MRRFEKIDFEQFKKDIINDKELYEKYLLPKRSSKYSGGYDFYAVEEVIINPGEIKKIPTGIKFKCDSDCVLLIIIRSSLGFKYNIRLCNQVGVIDSDYYNNIDNEGHIWISLQNEGNDVYVVEKNKAYAQGIIMKYLLCDDDKVEEDRTGGLGSSDKEVLK